MRALAAATSIAVAPSFATTATLTLAALAIAKSGKLDFNGSAVKLALVNFFQCICCILIILERFRVQGSGFRIFGFRV